MLFLFAYIIVSISLFLGREAPDKLGDFPLGRETRPSNMRTGLGRNPEFPDSY